jgi:hypothetical protein
VSSCLSPPREAGEWKASVGDNKGGRPFGTTLPEERRRSQQLTTRATPSLAQAVHQVAAAEQRTVATVVRAALLQYVKPRLAQQAAPGRPFSR